MPHSSVSLDFFGKLHRHRDMAVVVYMCVSLSSSFLEGLYLLPAFSFCLHFEHGYK